MVKKQTTTIYHLQTIAQAEQYNSTLIAGVFHYVFKPSERLGYICTVAYQRCTTQMHKATGTSPFNRTLLCEPPSAVTILTKITGHTNDMPRDVTPEHLAHLFLQQTELKKAVVLRMRLTPERRYKRHFDRNVRWEPTVEKADYVFLDHLQLVDIASDSVDEIKNCLHHKLLERAIGTYRVLRSKLHTTTTKEDGIPSTFSLNHLILSPTRAQVTYNRHETKQISWSRRRKQQNRNDLDDAKRATKHDASILQEQMVNCIRLHVNTSNGRKNVARKYGYGPRNYTIELLHHIRTSFIRQK